MVDYAFLPAQVPTAMAHRGGSDAAPENTLAAFQHAVDLGYHYLETDVHLTADGVLVAFHDDELDRVAGVSGKIRDLTWDEIAEVDLDGHRIPTMAQLFEAFPDARFNIDPKADSSVEALIDLIREHDAVDRVCIGSFSDERIARLRQALGPRLCTSPARNGIIKLLLAAYLYPGWRHGYGCLQIPTEAYRVRLDRPGLIRRWHRMGLQVHYWTINDRSEMERLWDAGADVVITDETELARNALADRGAWPSEA